MPMPVRDILKLSKSWTAGLCHLTRDGRVSSSQWEISHTRADRPQAVEVPYERSEEKTF